MNLAKKLMDEVAKSRKTVIVIGDRMVDQWVNGQLLPSQDGCDKFVQDSIVEVAGGAANARRTLSHWDVSVTMHSYSYDVPIKRRYVVDGKIVFRVDRERKVTNQLTPEIVLAQRGAIASVHRADAILLSDYDKGFLTPQFIREVSQLCRSRDIPCVADCKRAPEVYEGCILKCNGPYFTKYHSIISDNFDKYIATDGECHPCVSGTIHYNSDTNILTLPDDPKLPSVKCVNHVGAGDCFAAHMTLALAYGFSLRDAAALAHSAGRVYVQFPFNRPPFPCEVADDLANAR